MTTPSKIMLNGRKSVLFIEFFIGNDYICSYKYKYDEKKRRYEETVYYPVVIAGDGG